MACKDKTKNPAPKEQVAAPQPTPVPTARPTPTPAPTPTPVPTPQPYETATGIRVEFTETADNPKLMKGQRAKVRYKLSDESGTVIEETAADAEPMEVTVGMSGFRGMDQALMEMPIGARARFTIPAKIGFLGKRPAEIPEDKPLILEIETLARVEATPTPAGGN